MKTKEAIFKDLWPKLYVPETVNIETPVYAAMDEWAKQQILAFDIYKRDNHYIFEYAGQKYMKFGAAYVHERRLSLDELYAQFIDNQNTNQ